MIPEDKLREIATKLLEKSRVGKVCWQESRSGYHVDFPSSQIHFYWVSSVTTEDAIRLEITDSAGRTLGMLEVFPDVPDWSLLVSLQREAERSVTGWDNVLVEIESTLGKEGVIGAPEHSTESGRSVEDIPF